MHGLLDDMRIEAFRTIQSTTMGERTLPAPEAYAVDKFVDILGFDDTAEALDWCEFYSIRVLDAEDYVKSEDTEVWKDERKQRNSRFST